MYILGGSYYPRGKGCNLDSQMKIVVLDERKRVSYLRIDTYIVVEKVGTKDTEGMDHPVSFEDPKDQNSEDWEEEGLKLALVDVDWVVLPTLEMGGVWVVE